MRFIPLHNLILLMLAVLLTGCSLSEFDWSPEAAALRHLHADPRLELVEVVATRSWERGRVVLYRAMMQTGVHPGEGELIPVLGYMILERDGLGWRFMGGGAGSAGNGGPFGRRISYSSGKGSGTDHAPYSIVSGEVLAPEVAAVEVVFEDGQRLRDEATNGVFAIAVTGLVSPCALLLFDEENQLLEQIGPDTCLE